MHVRKKNIIFKLIKYSLIGMLLYFIAHIMNFILYFIISYCKPSPFLWRNLVGWGIFGVLGFTAFLDLEIKTRNPIYKLIIYGIYGAILYFVFTVISDAIFHLDCFIFHIIIAIVVFVLLDCYFQDLKKEINKKDEYDVSNIP